MHLPQISDRLTQDYISFARFIFNKFHIVELAVCESDARVVFRDLCAFVAVADETRNLVVRMCVRDRIATEKQSVSRQPLWDVTS